MSSENWVESEFGSHPLVANGRFDPKKLTILDRLGILHLTHILNAEYRFPSRISLDLFISAESHPAAEVLTSNVDPSASSSPR
jgi:hypothetical protein